MKISIKSIAGSLLFEGDFSSLAEALNAAIKSSADLRSADLRSADLRSADLRYADLRYANLSSANLRYANLSSANLRSADLRSADLRYANLSSANLRYANLSSAENADTAIAMTRILPEGSVIGWKKCCDDILVKLLIPDKAKRSHAFGRKCRAEFVRVLEVIGGDSGISLHDKKTKYAKGKTVKCDKWNEDFTVECGGGIHFFITKIEAEQFTY